MITMLKSQLKTNKGQSSEKPDFWADCDALCFPHTPAHVSVDSVLKTFISLLPNPARFSLSQSLAPIQLSFPRALLGTHSPLPPSTSSASLDPSIITAQTFCSLVPSAFKCGESPRLQLVPSFSLSFHSALSPYTCLDINFQL